jgi:hypothetical protein
LCINTDLKPFACPSSVRPRSCTTALGFPQGGTVPSKCAAYYAPTGSPSRPASPSAVAGTSPVPALSGSTVAASASGATALALAATLAACATLA